MKESSLAPWLRLQQTFPLREEERLVACEYFRALIFEQKPTLSMAQMKNLSLPHLFDFYLRLARLREPVSPFRRKKSSKWLEKTSIFFFDLKEMQGWLNLLRCAPLLQGTLVVITGHLQQEAQQLYSHVKLAEVPTWELAELYTVEEFVPLVQGALHRLNIGLADTLPLYVHPQAEVRLRMPQLFMEAPHENYFDLSEPEAITYLQRIVSRYFSQNNLDALVLNWHNYPQDLLHVQIWTPTLKQSLSQGLISTWDSVAADRFFDPHLTLLSDFIMPTATQLLFVMDTVVPLGLEEPFHHSLALRQIWRCLASLFRHAYRLEYLSNDESVAFWFDSHLISQAERTQKLKFITMNVTDGLSWVLFMQKKRWFLFLASNLKIDEGLIDLQDFLPTSHFYCLDEEWFRRDGQQRFGPQLFASAIFPQRSLSAGELLIYRII
jgi:hypothetical protein